MQMFVLVCKIWLMLFLLIRLFSSLSILVILEFKMLYNIFLSLLFFEQACFTFRQSVGVIGGKPNHAYYFIGFYGKCKFDFLPWNEIYLGKSFISSKLLPI